MALFCAISLGVVACRQDIDNEAAVRSGIEKYLAKRPDLSSMDVAVKSVSFRKNEADATVHFQAKGTTAPNSGMEMKYVLERKGDEWVVKGRTGNHAQMPPGMESPHGGSMEPGGLPPGHPPIGGQPATGRTQ